METEPEEEMLIPDGWVEGERMPPPPSTGVKPKWYTMTMGPIPADRKPFFDVVS